MTVRESLHANVWEGERTREPHARHLGVKEQGGLFV